MTRKIKTILFDCTRIILKINSANPSGIERTEIEYLRYILTNCDDFIVIGVYEAVNKANGLNYLIRISNELLSKMMNLCYARWVGGDVDIDPSIINIDEIILNISNSIKSVKLKKNTRIDDNIFNSINENSATYINCSYLTIPNGALHVEQISKLKIPTFYIIYDLIPVEFPEYMWNTVTTTNHLKILENIVLNGARLIAISNFVKNQVEDVLGSMNLKHFPIQVVECGISKGFIDKKVNINSYFPENKLTIFCTIEPRKNHILLLNIWRHLINCDFKAIPKLSIIGRRGWNNEDVFRFIDQSPALKGYVTEFNNMNDSDMISEIITSKATVFPSFSEGWGLPIVESLSLGVPVICSDIQVHRECSQGLAEFINPLDGIGWINKISEIGNSSREQDLARKKRTSAFKPIKWSDSSLKLANVIRSL